MEFFYIEDHRGTTLRSGESTAVLLADGSLLLMYSAYDAGGNADHSPAEIVSQRSTDGGHSWSEYQTVFRPPEGALNAISPSLLRLKDGRIGCVFAVKWSTTHCIPYWTASSDEGHSWSEPKPMTTAVGYFCINNDRLVELQDGTLVSPYAELRGIVAYADDKELLKEYLNGWCGIMYSEDGGNSWITPDNARKFQKDWYTPPNPLRLETMEPAERKAVEIKYDVFQEPGVIELNDGRLFMWVRSLCHIYYSFSAGKDAPWSDYVAMPGMNAPCAPQAVKRLPLTGDLIMIYNDRDTEPFGSAIFQHRTPLSLARSKDEGQSWQKLAPLEADQSRNYCYAGLLFFSNRFLATYYESTDALDEEGHVRQLADGSRRRRNLASLKACVGDQAELIGRQ